MKTKVKFINIDTNYCDNVTKVTLFAIPTNRYYDYLNVEQINFVEKLLTDFRYNNTVYRGFVVTGVAKCSPDDTFDWAVGYRIAESRANAKLYEKAAKFNRKCSDYIHENMMEFTAIYNRNSRKYIKEQKHLHTLLHG